MKVRFFIFCVVMLFVTGCRTKNYQHHEKLLNVIVNQSISHNECNIDDGIKKCAAEFFAIYFTEEELQDFVNITSEPKYKELQQELFQQPTMERQLKLAEFIQKNAKTDFFKKITSADFKKQYKKHLDTYIGSIIKTD